MKVLYIGHFHEGTSWSEAATNYVKALSLHTDVVCRSILIRGGKADPFIEDRLTSSLNGVTHVIQHVLPRYMEKGNIPCIGVCIAETQDLEFSGIKAKMDLMDAVWSPNKYHANRYNYHYVPHTFNINDYQYRYNLLPQLRHEIGDRYTFYTIGEHNTRKRLSAILRAFHTEFSIDDNVCLVIKTQCDPKQLHTLNDNIIKQLHLNKQFQTPITITEKISRQDILSLHANLDCFVSASYGEAFGIPAFEATQFGRPTIVTNCPGLQDFGSHVVSSHLEPCFGAEQYVENYHTSMDSWWSINIREMSAGMRLLYSLRRRDLIYSHDFSYETIGKKMVDLL